MTLPLSKPLSTLRQYLSTNAYAFLLVALLQHLFAGIFISDLSFYTEVVWPINMIILGMASVGIFKGKGKLWAVLRVVFISAAIILPLIGRWFTDIKDFFLTINITYVCFFIGILYELLLFLLKPGQFNRDVIYGAIDGFLLLVEIMTFTFQFLYYETPQCLSGVNDENVAATFMDLVYFCSITLSSIGYGDIVPSMHVTKLLAAFFAITGQFYTVVLVGILISKFSSANENSNKGGTL